MAWVVEDTFNTYSDGNLAGNNGGTGWSAAWGSESSAGAYKVQGTTVYEGAKAVSTASDDITRAFTTGVSGDGNIMYIAIRRPNNNDGSMRFRLRNATNQSRAHVGLNASGQIFGESTNIAAYSANTWYVLRVTVNVTSNNFTVAYSTDPYGSGSFSADSSTITMTNAGNITNILLASDAAAGNPLNYIDYISPTSPFSGAPPITVGRVDNLMLLGVS